MGAEEIRQYFQAYLDNELTPDARKLVETYIDRDPEGRMEFEAFRDTSAIMQAWQEAEPSPDFRGKVSAAVASQRQGRGEPGADAPPPTHPIPLERESADAVAKPARRRPWVKLVIGLAACAALMLVGYRAVFPRLDPTGGFSRRLSVVVARAEQPEELLDVGAAFRPAGFDAVSQTRLAPARWTLASVVDICSRHVKVVPDQRKDLQMLLRSFDNISGAPVAEHASLSGRLYAAEIGSAIRPIDSFDQVLRKERQGRYAEAVSEYMRLSVGGPLALSRVWLHECLCYVHLGQYQEARNRLSAILALETAPRSYHKIATELRLRVDAAEKAHNQCAALSRAALAKDAPPEKMIAYAHMQIRAWKLRDAAYTFQQYAELDVGPRDKAIALLKRAWCQRQTGRYAPARHTLEQAVQHMGTADVELKALVRFELGCLFEAEGRIDKAVDFFGRCHKVSAKVRRTATDIRAAAAFLCGYLHLYGRTGGPVDAADIDGAESYFRMIRAEYPSTPYAGVVSAYLGGSRS